jgi:hypothetical protein
MVCCSNFKVSDVFDFQNELDIVTLFGLAAALKNGVKLFKSSGHPGGSWWPNCFRSCIDITYTSIFGALM